MNKPLVSVIMTTYNAERFVTEALRSISNQLYPNIEICMHDDGSTDRTYLQALKTAVAEVYPRGFKIRTSKSDRNEGVGAGRNKAIANACGEYIAIQDADDISFPYRIEEQVQFLEEHRDIFCVSGGMEKIDENGKFIENMFQPETHLEIVKKIFVENINGIFDPACMFRKKHFDSIGGYNSPYKLIPDLDLWIKSIKGGFKFHNIKKIFVKYRKHDNSNCSRYLKEMLYEHNCLMEKNRRIKDFFDFSGKVLKVN